MKTLSHVAADVVRIPVLQLEQEFFRVLTQEGFHPEKAQLCAHIFAENSLDGVYTHGVNRFARFVHSVKDGYIKIHAEPIRQHRAGAIEQWDGCLGPGPLNALFCTERAIEVSKKNGMGCIGLSNTNHWMRGGTYGWKAAKAGFLFIGWTNTIANMPAWGAVDCRLGNNPIVFAAPYQNEAIVLDMAMSQFSYGTLEVFKRQDRSLPVPGGYDSKGQLTTHPSEILDSHRVLPMGYWKGSGLALLLDLFATVLSGGLSTEKISTRGIEIALSQVFIAIDISQLNNHSMIAETVNSIIQDYSRSVPSSESSEIMYPGKRVLRVREENLAKGIPIEKNIWEEILKL